MLATIVVPCWKVLETLAVLDPEPVSDEVSVPRTRSAASPTMSRAASLSDRLVDRLMSRFLLFLAALLRGYNVVLD